MGAHVQLNIRNFVLGRVRHGTLYDMASKVFTCPACNFVFKKCHLVKFIYHRKKCSMDSELVRKLCGSTAVHGKILLVTNIAKNL